MSQTETILLIVLGFSLATLLALFMGRMLWTAAVKVGARRMQRQVPSSLVGLQTERDRLRAEYAMLANRLGSRLEEAKLKLAEQTAEVSRHRNRLHDLEHGEDGRKAELRQLKSRVTSLERELAESTAREEALRQSLVEAEAKLLKAKKKKGYEPAPRTPEQPPPPGTDEAELRLRQRIDKLSKLAKQPEPDLADRLAEAERQTHDLEKELTELDAKWTAKQDADARGSV